MQFIEKNSFNLRAAVYSLKKDSTSLEFVVFPMIGVLYGAFHMRSVMPFLMQGLNYRVVKADWVKVFDL